VLVRIRDARYCSCGGLSKKIKNFWNFYPFEFVFVLSPHGRRETYAAQRNIESSRFEGSPTRSVFQHY
jgi:hypothetical protein